MSFFSSIASGLFKGIAFIEKVFTETSNYAAILSKLSPTIMAAILATFYDVVKALEAAEAAALAAGAGDIPVAFTLSETTLALLQKVWLDLKADDAAAVAAFKALSLPMPPVSVPIAG